MNNRIDEKFKQLGKENKKALITFITAGDPDISLTKRLVLEMERSGADLIELGIPFSDPIAEGPVIQEANIRALSNGIHLDIIFNAVSMLREVTQIPIVFLMYYNSILHYGPDAFFTACAESGVDGVIIPDLPFEESGEIAEYTEKYGVYQISLAAPTSSPERLERIAGGAKGFLYCVSSMGVTGMRESFDADFHKMFSLLDRFEIPKCIGFGISKPEHIKKLKNYGDGLIVGSAIVNECALGKTPDEKVNNVSALTSLLKSAF